MNEPIKIFIPENRFGIPEKRYSINEFVELLRLNKHRPSIIQFLADMLEE